MKMRDRIGLTLVVLLAAAALAALLGWIAVQRAANQPGVAVTVQDFEVAKGATLRTILRSLEQKELITSARNLELYLRCCQRGTSFTGEGIKAGRYRIPPGQVPLSILRQLTDGRVVLEQVTIIEGWTFSQMRAELEHHKSIQPTMSARSDADIMQALQNPGLAAEGRFAPDTYSFAPGTTDLQLLRMAFEAQRRTLEDAWKSRAPDLPLNTMDEALVLASIVEKETGLASERARVAGVFINRLRKSMRLQSDPTVIYGIRDHYDGNIRKRDLTTDTPYNSYTRDGLPPTPIALPGRDSIVATLHPEKTDALFFVATGDGSGGHYFSATVSEHNQAVQRYLDRLRRVEPAAEKP
ncbi:MAG: endolytic transglycosylase MltG [Pseudomonadota bacterium]